MREYVIAAYELDEATVYTPAASEEDFRVCATCNQAGTATDNPLLECVAQCKEAHYRMRRVGLDYMPGSWLCAPCVAIPVHVIRHIIGKRLLNNRTEYNVPTWQALRDIPPGSPTS